jgi:four helix bundle protein
MANWTTFPHENLIAYQVARELLQLVCEANIRDPKIRDQAMRAAQSVCLNIAEATGRASSADQKRVYAIARGEACEAAAALDVAEIDGECSRDLARRARTVALRAYALLSGLIRS